MKEKLKELEEKFNEGELTKIGYKSVVQLYRILEAMEGNRVVRHKKISVST